ncbi:hypothetical protein DFJ58DRAFT_736189 [Suillus subalutaceus]|uniref:uncharacterized protein n=1 Tax=Suillus subalutaceus TaxID=48586 RepID=UPI001B86F376|nr:uncharacterized protein DFJ58DRAFT_736189 [Suillus subalutaceus]KAG1833195.1 hypothetical protein DFJ58DRAFT_736189 [Suillus subalutaceus]
MSIAVGRHEDPSSGLEHESYVYDLEFAGLTMLSGLPTFTITSWDISPLALSLHCIPFIAHLLVTKLWLKNHISLVAYMVMPIEHFPVFETSPSNEVPVFVLASAFESAMGMRQDWHQWVMHGVYRHDGIACKHKTHTIIHHVEFPAGFYSSVPELYFPNADDDNNNVTLSDIFWQGRSVVDSSIAMSWKESTVNAMLAGPSSVLGTMPADTQA